MNRIKLGLSILNSASKAVVSRAKSVTSPIIRTETAKLADDVGMDIVNISGKSNPKTITQAEFELNYIKTENDTLRIFPFEKDKAVRIAQKADGSYDKEILDFIFEIKRLGLQDGNNLSASVDMAQFVLNNGRLDSQMKNELLNFINTTKACDRIDDFFYEINNHFHINYNIETRREILKLFTSFPEEVKDWGFSRGMARLIKGYITEGLDTAEITRRISKLKDIYDNYDYRSYNPGNLIRLAEPNVYRKFAGADKDKAYQYFCDFIDSGVEPSEAMLDYYVKCPDKVLDAIKIFKERGIKYIDLDDDFARDLVCNPDKKSILEKLLKDNCENKYDELLISSSPYSPNLYTIGLADDTGGISYIFDKGSSELISVTKTKMTDTVLKRKKIVPAKHTEAVQEYRAVSGEVHEQLKNERISTAEDIRYYIENNIPGQGDIFRVKNGNVEVLAKSFRDPITGETVIKRHFTSYAGVKSNYNFTSTRDGNYSLSYMIKDGEGNTLMNINRSVQTIDDNHYVYMLNNRKYDVQIENNLIKITEQDGKQTLINLDDFVLAQENNEKILEMLRRMPPDELLKIKNIKSINQRLNFVPSDDESGCVYSWTQSFGNLKYIAIGPEDCDTMFVYLHEIGHLKGHLLEKEAVEKIKETYIREVNKYKENMDGLFVGSMDYLVDNTEHYLNKEGLGALEEVIADVNAHIKYPNSDRDLAERTIKFMEQFPETIAEIAKYL